MIGSGDYSRTITIKREHETLTVALRGEIFDEQKHIVLTQVKAVTYHQLEFRPDGGQWVGRVVLDL